MSNNVINLEATTVRSYGKNTFIPKPFEHIYTCNTGDIIPIFATIQINPGSTWKLTTSALARLNTSRYPTIARGWLEYMWCYAPMWQLWEHWNNLMGAEPESAWISTQTYSVPKIEIPQNKAIQCGHLLDHFGWRIGIGDFEASALKVRAYCWFCDQFARDPNIEAPFALATDDNSITYLENGDWTTGGKPYQINRKADYFSTALPEPFRGPDVLLPLGTEAPVIGNGIALGLTDGTDNFALRTQGSDLYSFDRATTGYGQDTGTVVTGGTAGVANKLIGVTNDPEKSGMIADLSESEGPSLFAVREAFTTLHIYERDARSGPRIGEQLYARWGVEIDPLELGRPLILTMGRFPIDFEQVPQTSQTTTGAGGSEQGTLTAFGYTNNREENGTFSFKQHGCLMLLGAIRFEHKYQYGIPQEDMKFDRFDFWHPEFAGLGDQPIYDFEIYATGGANGTIATRSIFGYAVRGAEYQNYPSIISGQVRSEYSNSMDYVHMADKYNSLPTLSSAWMKENPDNVDRTIFVSSSLSDQWLVDVVVEMEITDTMPLYSIPGIDRL